MVVCALALAIAFQQPTQPITRLDVRVEPLVDLYTFVRSLSERAEPLPDLEGISEAVLLAKELQDKLQFTLHWGFLDSNLEQCKSARELAKAFAELPDTIERAGRKIDIGDAPARFAESLERVEGAFLDEFWPERKKKIDAACAMLKERFDSKSTECLKHLQTSLGMQDPGAVIPVYLTVDGPFPGAVTYLGQNGGGVCFVAVGPHEGSVLIETILHEATHALDVATSDQSTVLQELRKGLTAAGISSRDPKARDIPHTVMFVQAAYTVRSCIDSAHEDYGVSFDYYRKVGQSADIVRECWTRFLDGECTREEALAAMISRAIAK